MSDINKRIIIEGCDGVGKDTFINHFMAYIRGESLNGKKPLDSFGRKNFDFVKEEVLVRKRDGLTVAKILRQNKIEDFKKEYEKHPNRFHTETSTWQPRWAADLSVTSVHSRDSSPEANAFLDRLDGGQVTDQNLIAEEYLQIHFDLERLCLKLDPAFDIIIQNRSLASFYGYQLGAMGLKEYEEKWAKLWRWSQQRFGIFIHLTMPEDALRERLKKRQGEDFRGEVENTYMSRAAAIEESFKALKRGDTWMRVFTFNVNRPVEEYYEFFDEVLQFRHKVKLYDNLNK